MKDLYTQDIVEVSDILDNGTIVTTDGRYVTIMEILAQNFVNKDGSEQGRIINNYLRFLVKFGKNEKNFRIKIVNQAMQTDSYTQLFKDAQSEETNSSVKEMIKDHIDFVKQVSSGNAIDKRFYLIFDYDPKTRKGTDSSTPLEQILLDIENSKEIVRSYFKEMGNPVKEFEDPFIDVTSLLYNYFNRDFMFSRPLNTRYARIRKDYKTVYGIEGDEDLPLMDIRDLIAPRSIIDVDEEYLAVNSRYYCHLYIEANNYPKSISPFSWINDISALGIGFDVDVFYEKLSRKESLEKLKWMKKLTVPRASEARMDDENYMDVMAADESVRFFQEALKGNLGDSEAQDMYQMYTLITVSSSSKSGLKYALDALEDIAIKYDCTIMIAKYLQREAFMSAAPCGNLDARLKPVMHHNVSTAAVGAAYPFTSLTLSDKEGVVLGLAPGADGLITYNSFDPRYTNGNLVILGKSGAGKTFTLSAYTTRQRMLGVQNFILTPSKSEEFIPICNALGGTFVNVSPTSITRVNPFDIFPMDSVTNDLLYERSGDEKSWLSEKVSRLKIFYKYFIPDMLDEEAATMGRITEKIYNDKGITTNNRSIYTKKDRNVKKMMPTYADLYREIEKEVKKKMLRPKFRDVFAQFVTGVYREMNGQTNVDLDNKYIVFGFDSFNNNSGMLAPMMYIVLEYVMGKVKEDKTKAKIVSLDEGWRLLDDRSPEVATFVEETWRTIRSYRGAGVFATQSIGDFFNAGKAVATAVLNNSDAQILLGVQSTEIEEIQERLHLSDQEASMLLSFDKGQALLCAGENHLPIRVIASEKEKYLYSTDAASLNAKLKKIKEERDRKK